MFEVWTPAPGGVVLTVQVSVVPRVIVAQPVSSRHAPAVARYFKMKPPKAVPRPHSGSYGEAWRPATRNCGSFVRNGREAVGSRYRPGRIVPSALRQVDRQAAERRFLVAVTHVVAGALHGGDHLVEADRVLAVAQ